MKTFMLVNGQIEQKFKTFFVLYTIVALVVAVAGLATTRITGDISQAAVELDTAALLGYLWFLTIAMGIKALFSAAQVYILDFYNGRVAFKLRSFFARHFVRLPYADFEKKSSGEVLSAYSNDVNASADFLSAESLNLIGDTITVIVSVGFMFIINPLFALIFFAMFSVCVLLQTKVSKPIETVAIEMFTQTAKFNALVQDCLQNTSVVIAYSLEDVFERRYLEAYDRFFTALKKFILTSVKLVLSSAVASIVPLLVIMSVSGASVISGDMELAEFIAFVGVAGAASNWLAMLSQRLQGIRVSQAGAQRLLEITKDLPENIDIGKPLDVKKNIHTKKAIELKNVYFSYSGDDVFALNDINITINEGERVAIVGGSGSGKSTILKLLLGIYPAGKGEICLYDNNYETVSNRDIRSQIAYVPQDAFMFPGTIGGNIAALPLERADMEKLTYACEYAGILDFIEGLPNKFQSNLTESAENISGGQRQRLAISRALYKDSSIILFDEATSALDPITEGEILQTLRRLDGKRTMIFVTHRSKTILSCERIVLIANGSVIADGSHVELLETNESYKAYFDKLVMTESRGSE